MKQCRSCPFKHPYNQNSRCFYPRNEPQPRRVLVDSTRGSFFLLFTLLLNRRPSSKCPASSGAAKAACHWPRNPFSVQRSHSWRSSTWTRRSRCRCQTLILRIWGVFCSKYYCEGFSALCPDLIRQFYYFAHHSDFAWQKLRGIDWIILLRDKMCVYNVRDRTW